MADVQASSGCHTAGVQLLNIPVSPDLLLRWRGYLAPNQHHFFLTAAEAQALELPTQPCDSVMLTPEQRDTYTTWQIPQEADQIGMLSTTEFDALSSNIQRQMLALQVKHKRGNVPLGRHFRDFLPDLPAGRFLWRPEYITPEVLSRIIAKGQRPCQRQQVPQAVWDAAAPVLPRVRDLAGTWPQGSAGNCFGAVMGAAGVVGAEHEWMQREPFEAFLTERTKKGGQDADAGTILLWRSADGLVQHAAVTLGGGWAFEKASQTWMTPRTVLPTRELIAANRTEGWRLTRHTLR
ncbi:hypothetical protein Dxin01_02080 [Deinococcus xinjiangensis]|uniref:Uncharacterized protein n=1 Tax=Deinococcus xinjiangensis TaxID=457454 RepID=A0ABP9VAP1_9DEIO